MSKKVQNFDEVTDIRLETVFFFFDQLSFAVLRLSHENKNYHHG